MDFVLHHTFNKNSSGVYMIRNKITEDIYVGGTKRGFKQRFLGHRKKLRAGVHNKLLQADFQKYGEDNFEFVPLEEYDKDLVTGMEQYWFNLLSPKYCSRLHTDSNMGIKGRWKNPVSESRKKNISEATKIAMADPAIRAKISAAKRGRLSTRVKAVMCIETGEVFTSAPVAARAMGAKGKKASAVTNMLRGKSKKAYGKTWKYL